MRVVLVGPYPLEPMRAGGGVATSSTTLLTALSELPDVEPHALSFVAGLAERTKSEINGVPVHFVPGTRRLGNLLRYPAERRALPALLSELEPDLVHAQDALLDGYVCLKASRSAPVVVSVHGITRREREQTSNIWNRMRLRVAGAAFETYCIRNARFLVSPTRYAADYFGSEVRGRMWDVPNPIADPFFAVEPDPKPGRILHAGSLISRKRLLDLVEAMPAIIAAAPDAHLRVTGGETDTAYTAQVRARIRELGLSSRVEILGGLSFRQLLDEYRRSSVLVLPSGEETSPMVIAEAMAASVPVVATRVGGVHYLVQEAATGHLVDVGDVDALAARVASILATPERQRGFAAAGRERALRDFRAAAVAERMRSIYLEVTRSN